jgi:hypothetical protein
LLHTRERGQERGVRSRERGQAPSTPIVYPDVDIRSVSRRVRLKNESSLESVSQRELEADRAVEDEAAPLRA